MMMWLIVIALIYGVLVFVLWANWQHMCNQPKKQPGFAPVRISVLVPVRNEAANLPNLFADLAKQQYPSDLFEVIIANDASTDSTVEVVMHNRAQQHYQIKLLHVSHQAGISPKKRAVSEAIRLASGELIVTTDGDCRLAPTWLSKISSFYTANNAKFISAPVAFTEDRSLFTRLQIVEFASLVGTGAVSIFLQRPNMCNGANIAYPKTVFEAVGGFDGNETLASGDDEFLMHKIFAKYPNDVHFLLENEAIVYTQPQKNLQSFYFQRKRWASKWRFYQHWQTSALAVFIFLVNSMLLLCPALCWFGYISWQNLLLIGLVKCLPEVLFLHSVLRFLYHKNYVLWILLTQLFYPVYVSFFAIAAQWKGYQWKGRKLH